MQANKNLPSSSWIFFFFKSCTKQTASKAPGCRNPEGAHRPCHTLGDGEKEGLGDTGLPFSTVVRQCVLPLTHQGNGKSGAFFF